MPPRPPMANVRPAPRPSVPPQGGMGQIPYAFPQIERPLTLGQGQPPGWTPNYPLWTYPQGGAGLDWQPSQWFDQFSQDLETRADFEADRVPDAIKLRLADIYRSRGMPVPPRKRLTALFGGRHRRAAKKMIEGVETARGIGNLTGGAQVLANQGVDYMNNYLNQVFNPQQPAGTPAGGTASFPGGIGPAEIMNLGSQYLMGGEIGILPGMSIGGGGQSLMPGVFPSAGGQ